MSSSRIEVFAVEDDAAQVGWGHLPAGTVRIEAGPAVVEVDHPGGPGVADLPGLPADTALDLVVDGRRVSSFRTLAPPPGRLLARFATVSDVHIGEQAFGYFHTIRDVPGHDVPYPERCLAAALRGAKAWGAEHLVVKGDVTAGSREREFARFAELVVGSTLPVSVVLGNHDVRRRAADGVQVLGAYGVPATRDVLCTDLPGIRLLAAHTPVPGHGYGMVRHDTRDRVLELAAGAPGGVFLGVHHWFQRLPVPTTWPPGVPSTAGNEFLDALAVANPATFVSSGHTHRNRRRHRGPLVLTQVGSTKDWPAAWAGYAVHEGGIRQVVRRITGADVLPWVERSRRAVGGQWPRWSSGSLAARCFSHPWPPRPR